MKTIKNATTRVVGRGAKIARNASQRSGAAQASATTPLRQSVVGSKSAEPSKMRDPCMVALAVMLRRAMKAAALKPGELRKRGAIIVVRTPSPEWTRSSRKTWEELFSRESGVLPKNAAPTVLFVRGEEHAPRSSYRDDDEFPELCWRGVTTVGVAPNVDWLPSDLVTAADLRIELEAPNPDALKEIARRLTGNHPSVVLTDTEASAVTPRLLRLASRPRWPADKVLCRLRELIAREEHDSKEEADASEPSETPPVVARSPTPREEPHLDRLFGMDDAVQWGHNLDDDLVAFAAGTRAWADVDRGVLLSGPPGVGKTMFARALANTCHVPLFTGSYAIWIGTGSGHQGDLIRAMRKLFADAKRKAPAIIFIDEMDSIADRDRINHVYRQWDVQVCNALLAELDGVEGREGVVLVAACNNPNLLDPALIRAGRLDRHIRIGLPDRRALVQIMRQHLGSALQHEDLDGVAALALGFTGADVERATRGARRRARQAGREMTLADLMAEVAGPDARTAEELWTVAVHEAGHAVAGHALGVKVEGVSLRASGGSGGHIVAAARAYFISPAQLNDHLTFLLSGRAAEEVILGVVTSGSGGSGSSDLAIATRLAATAASEFGYEDALGLLWKGVPDRQGELGPLLASDPQLAAVVRERLATAYPVAIALVQEHRAALLAVAQQLIERVALSSDQLADVLGPTPRRSKS